MNIAETAYVLTAAAAFDQRTIGEADAAAWHAVIGHLQRDECLAAVKAHYAAQTRRLMPADVIDLVLSARRDAAARASIRDVVRAQEPGDYEAGAGKVRGVLGWDPQRIREHRQALARQCPWCGAAPGAPCVVQATGRPLTQATAHPSRLDVP